VTNIVTIHNKINLKLLFIGEQIETLGLGKVCVFLIKIACFYICFVKVCLGKGGTALLLLQTAVQCTAVQCSALY